MALAVVMRAVPRALPEPDWVFWRNTVSSGDATFLVGAGISHDPPASLPLAADLIEHLIRPLVMKVQLRPRIAEASLQAIRRLRPEVVADVLIELIGAKGLLPLDAALRGRPNPWHRFLAAAIGRTRRAGSFSLSVSVGRRMRPSFRSVTVAQGVLAWTESPAWLWTSFLRNLCACGPT